jgi:hypothetical protein
MSMRRPWARKAHSTVVPTICCHCSDVMSAIL